MQNSDAALPPIQIENSLTRKREPLAAAVPGRIGMYVCGVTVYDHCHLGHAMSAVTFDAIRRYLEFRGYLVDYVYNFTDVDDKILNRAAAEGVDYLTISERYIASFHEDMDRLGVKRASVHPRATRHIPEMLEMIRVLVERDIAYPVDGDVYFDVTRFAGYGKLSGRKVDELVAGARVAADARLRQPADFALWKGAKPGEPGWESPWGKGRPGWHIECSAMSMKYLGKCLDIHGGGLDLVFPHHENEIAQSEALTGRPFARHWMHNGILNLGGEKMSKSIGNVLGLKLLFQKHSPDALRLYLLGSHYRSPQNFEEDSLDRAGKAHQRFANVFERAGRMLAGAGAGAGSPEAQKQLAEQLSRSSAGARSRFHQHMSEDFNSGGALGALFELAAELNRAMQASESDGLGAGLAAAVREARSSLEELLGVLGIGTGLSTPTLEAAAGSGLIPKLIEFLLELRLDAKKSKNFTLADSIRKRLAELGVELKDTATGTSYTTPVR
ncbi:MAG: cysteine--tRNA ligase [Candidatus Wallbacteria bacterium]|nr:cysteine--tRNA ligase [Candidatus Wallbacteria bacterium]